MKLSAERRIYRTRRVMGEAVGALVQAATHIAYVSLPGGVDLVETEADRVDLVDRRRFRLLDPLRKLRNLKIVGIGYRMADDRANAKGRTALHEFSAPYPVLENKTLIGAYTVGPEGIQG